MNFNNTFKSKLLNTSQCQLVFWFINITIQILRFAWIFHYHEISSKIWQHSRIFRTSSLKLFGENRLVTPVKLLLFNKKSINPLQKSQDIIELNAKILEIFIFQLPMSFYKILSINRNPMCSSHIHQDLLHMPHPSCLISYFFKKHH